MRDVELFRKHLFSAWVAYRERYRVYSGEVRAPITDHADPAVYVLYVQAVARRVVAVFEALVSDLTGRTPRGTRNSMTAPVIARETPGAAVAYPMSRLSKSVVA